MRRGAVAGVVITLVGIGSFVACSGGDEGSRSSDMGQDTNAADGLDVVTDVLTDLDVAEMPDPGTGQGTELHADAEPGHETGADWGDVPDGKETTAPAVDCGGLEQVFPDFDKACESHDDCALVFHTVNCCGTNVAWGIRADEVPAFDAAEAICDSQQADCGCAQDMTQAEDGNRAYDPAAFAVSCIAGSCRSLVPRGCDDIAAAYFEEAQTLDYCTAPGQCELVPSDLPKGARHQAGFRRPYLSSDGPAEDSCSGQARG